jgi:dihydroorotase-like cyclic amidohydrolase
MVSTTIHSVLLFDGESVHKNATVTFDSSKGTITSVSLDKSAIPEDTTVIDGKGHTLLPGLIESHMHCHGLHLPPGANEEDALRQSLKSGVTTLCDMHSDVETVHKHRARIAEDLKQAEKSGALTMSDLKSSLLGATIEGGWPKPIVLGHDPSEEVSRSGILLLPSQHHMDQTCHQNNI